MNETMSNECAIIGSIPNRNGNVRLPDTIKGRSISGIYKIINKINGKYYVGSSTGILGCKGRWAEHRCCLKYNNHGNGHLQSAWNKYGKDSFVFQIIEEVPFDLLVEVEQRYLDIAKSEPEKTYNLVFSAESPRDFNQYGLDKNPRMLGKHHSLQTIERMRLAASGRIIPLRQREKIRQSLLGEKSPRFKRIPGDLKNLLIEFYKSNGWLALRRKGLEFGIKKGRIDRLVAEIKRQLY